MKRIIALVMTTAVLFCCSACLEKANEKGVSPETALKTEEVRPETNSEKMVMPLEDSELKNMTGGVWLDADDDGKMARRYTNTFAGVEFIIPGAVYSFKEEGSDDVEKKWIDETVEVGKKEGLIPVMKARKNTAENVNNVAVYMEKVAEGVTPQEYIQDIEKGVADVMQKPCVGKFFESEDDEKGTAVPETWIMLKKIGEGDASAVQKVVVFENRKGFMTTIIITADSSNADIVSEWFKTTAI